MNFFSASRSAIFALFFVMGLSLLFSASNVNAADSKSHKTSALVREAYLGAKDNLLSGAGIGTYEHYWQNRGDATMSLRVQADAKIWFDKDKYHISLTYKKNIRNIRSTRIIFDGKLLMKTEEYLNPGSQKVQTRSQLYPSTVQLGSPELAGFPFNPSKLPDAAFYMGPKSGKRWDNLTIADLASGGYLGRCPFGRDRMEFDFPPQFGFNPASSRIYNEGCDRPVAEAHAVWEQTKGTWYVKSLSDTFYPPGSPASKNVLAYTRFQPNIAIDKELFRVSALQMSANSAIIDRRPDAQHKVYRNQPSRETTSAEVDSMAEYIKTLPPRETGRKPVSPLLIRLWLLIGGSVLIVFGFFWIWRRRRSQNRTV